MAATRPPRLPPRLQAALDFQLWRQVEPRRDGHLLVPSLSEGGQWQSYVVRVTADHRVDRCSCLGGRGECAHRWAAALYLWERAFLEWDRETPAHWQDALEADPAGCVHTLRSRLFVERGRPAPTASGPRGPRPARTSSPERTMHA
jgi:hypothetical protein